MHKIRIERNAVHSLNVSQAGDGENDEGKISLDYETHFDSEDKKRFAVSFQTSVMTEDISIDANYVSYFVAGEDIEDESHASAFFHVNAPAIGYPFLRAYVANLMLSSGYPILMMPTVNFVELAKEKTKRLGKKEEKTD